MSVKFLSRTGLFHRLTYETITWTTFTQDGTDQIIYVSNSGGSDSYTGLAPTFTSGTNGPKATIAAGKALLRNGHADWLLLKKGDTWTNENIGTFAMSGRSATQKMLIGSYGSGARPLVQTGSAVFIDVFAQEANIAIVGIEMVAHTYDRSSPGIGAINFLSSIIDNLIIEDCYIHGFRSGIIISHELVAGGYGVSVYIRGCTIYNNWDNNFGGNDSQHGLYISMCDDVLVEFCSFIQNGWTGASNYSQFAHNVYIQSTNGSCVFKNNHIIYGDGVQFRAGGILTKNVASRLITSLSLGGGADPVVGGVPITCEDNVVLDGQNLPTTGLDLGWGIIASNINSGTIKRNIVANSSANGWSYYFHTRNGASMGVCNAIFSDNISCDWGGAALRLDNGATADYTGVVFDSNVFQNPNKTTTGAIVESSFGFTSSNMITSNSKFTLGTSQTRYASINGVDYTVLSSWLSTMGDSGSSVGPKSYVDSSRDLGKYNQYLGGANSHDAFMTSLLSQSRDSWNGSLTAPAFVAYMKAGFA